MSAFRRPRIKASVTHLASLAGKRRVVVNNHGNEESQTNNNEVTKNKETPLVDNINVPNLENNDKSLIKIEKVPDGQIKEQNKEEKSGEADEKKNAIEQKPRLKSRFRPNLGGENRGDQRVVRLRKTSNCESGSGIGSPVFSPRIRTTSSGSNASNDSQEAILNESQESILPDTNENNFENEDIVSNEQEVTHAISSENELSTQPAKELSRERKISEHNVPTAETSETFKAPERPARTRKLSESSVQSVSTVYKERKANHLKKFKEIGDEIPERTRLTMFDLIYYNPTDGNKMSNPATRKSSRVPSPDRDDAQLAKPACLDAVAEKLREEAVDDPDAILDETQDENDGDAMPAPQVRVAADGSIILDEASLHIETTSTKKAKNDLITAPLVFENANQASNYGTWNKKKKHSDWSSKKTVKFYKALSVFGTDFSLMQGVFKKKTRTELRLKFKKEEKINRKLIEKCLSQGQIFDPSIFDSDEDSEEEEEREKEELKQKKIEMKEEKKKEREMKKEEKKREKEQKMEEKKREKLQKQKTPVKKQGKVANPRARKLGAKSKETIPTSSEDETISDQENPDPLFPIFDISENNSENLPSRPTENVKNPKSREIIPSSSKNKSNSGQDIIEVPVPDPLQESENNSSNKKRKTGPNVPENLSNSPAKKSKNESIVELKNCKIVEVTPEYEKQRAKNIEAREEFLENSPIHSAKKSLRTFRPKKTVKPNTVKERILPGRRASQKPQNSYAEDHDENSQESDENSQESNENSQDSDKFCGLPPALLAANPGLANATSGSLVVVASTNSEDHAPISQVLEVYNEETETGTGNERKTSDFSLERTRTTSEGHLDTTSIGRVRTYSGSYGT